MPTINKSYKIVAENPSLRTLIYDYIVLTSEEPKKSLFNRAGHREEHLKWMENCQNARNEVKQSIRNLYPEFADEKHSFGSCRSYNYKQVITFEIIREMEIIVE